MSTKRKLRETLLVHKWVSMRFDSLLIDYLGEFGRYQKTQYLLLCIPAIFTALHKLAWVFLGVSPPHRCFLPIETDSYTAPNAVLNRTIPYDAKFKRYDQCNMYKINYSDPNWKQENKSLPSETVPCTRWKFDHTYFKTSTVIHYNLVCELSWTKALGQSIFMIGALLGSGIFGYFSDKFGRQKTFFISIMIMTISGCLATIMPDFWTFIAARAVVGATTSGVFLVAFVLGLELVGPKYRRIAGISIQFFFAFGYVLTSLIAYLSWDWRVFQIAISLPSIIFITYWWCIPESARWLMTQQRFSEAETIIVNAAFTNNVVLPEHLFEEEIIFKTSKYRKKATSMDLFRRPNLCYESLNMLFNWFVNSLVYYGLSLNTSNLGANPYVIFAISGAVEIPAYIMCIIIIDKIGRRLSLCFCMMLGGVSLMAIMLIPVANIKLLISFAMLGKFAISASYSIIYVFSAELFPTPVRNVGVGISSMGARVGGIIAPFFLLLAEIERWLPNVTFGALALGGGVLSLFLPETMNMPLPETISEGENFGKNSTEKRDKARLRSLQSDNGDEPEPGGTVSSIL